MQIAPQLLRVLSLATVGDVAGQRWARRVFTSVRWLCWCAHHGVQPATSYLAYSSTVDSSKPRTPFPDSMRHRFRSEVPGLGTQ